MRNGSQARVHDSISGYTRQLLFAQLFLLQSLCSLCVRAEVVEKRINLLGSYGLGGHAVLLEQDWIYLKPWSAPAPVGYRPTLGLYAGWIFDEGIRTDVPAHRLAFGGSTKIWGLPDDQDANFFFSTRFGATYIVASAGVSIPFARKLPLPPPPPPSESKGPRFHLSLGAAFTDESVGPTIFGGKWFGGQTEVGFSLLRGPRRQLILGTRITSAGANPRDGFAASRPGLLSAALTLAYQDLRVPETGIGYRVTTGGRYFTRYRDHWGRREGLMPIFGIAVLVPTRSGFYPFLEFGLLPGPVILGIGRSL